MLGWLRGLPTKAVHSFHDTDYLAFQNSALRDKMLRPQVKTLVDSFLASRITVDEFFLAFQSVVLKGDV
jgi:hypothetical protein